MQNFKTYDLALKFYHLSRTLVMERHLKEQLARAAASTALNLAEGRGRRTIADQRRFFHIAFGSVRECQAILALAHCQGSGAWTVLDSLAASLYRLIQSMG